MNTLSPSWLAKITPTFRFLYGRWIHIRHRFSGLNYISSDSSMVDEYEYHLPPHRYRSLFRFLYGRWILSGRRHNHNQCQVQIPLWSMNTLAVIIPVTITNTFRFLYGRWIRPGLAVYNFWDMAFRFLYGRWILPINFKSDFPILCSDSSMVDEYPLRRICTKH